MPTRDLQTHDEELQAESARMAALEKAFAEAQRSVTEVNKEEQGPRKRLTKLLAS